MTPFYKLKRVAQNLYRNETTQCYYAIVTKNAKRRVMPLATTDRETAERKLRSYQLEVSAGSGPITELHCFADAVKLWQNQHIHWAPNTAKRMGIVAENLLLHFGEIRLDRLTEDLIIEWAQERMDEVETTTFNLELETLRSVLQYLVKRRVLPFNPAGDIQNRRRVEEEQPTPTDQQVAQLVAHLDVGAPVVAFLVRFLCASGLRIAEALAVTWADIDLTRGVLTVHGNAVTGPKNHHRRTIPINPRLHDLLATSPAPAIGMGDFLFAGVTEQQARKAVRDACSATGLPDFTFHAFRRYFGTLCIRSGVDIPTVARWMGHKDGGRLLLKTYSAAQEDHQREQAKKVLVAA